MSRIEPEPGTAPPAEIAQAPCFAAAGNALPSPRYHSLDALRAFAMLLGILLHAAIPYLRLEGLAWPVVDEAQSTILTLLVKGIHAFRMQVFFVMAGFFAVMLVRRRGVAGFLRHRGKRILAPFLLCLVLLVPLMQAICVWGYGSMSEETFARVTATRPEEVAYRVSLSEFFLSGQFFEHFQLFHVWFLWYLLVLYAVFLAPLAVSERILATSIPDRLLARIMRSPARAIWMAPPTAVLMYFVPSTERMTHVGTYVPLLCYFGFFFAFGGLLFRQPRLIEETRRHWWVHLGCAGALSIFLALRSHAERPPGGAAWLDIAWRLEGAAWHSLLTWLMVFGLMGLFVRYFDRPVRSVRYVSDSSYWLYLVHLPLIIVLQAGLVDWPASGLAKSAVILMLATPVMLLSYEYLVRYTLIGNLLNGPRHRAGERPAA